MTDSHEVLRTLAMVLLVAGVTTLLFNRLRQPVVFGYLLAGMVVGPHIPIPLVANEPMVHTMAELGVILLMFGLGLEFSFRKLLAVGPTAGVVAVLQTTTMVALGFLAGQAFGWTTIESVYAGAVIAISSTTIIVKAFAEQHATGRFVQVAFGVLVIEDLIAIFLLAVLTAIAGGGGLSPADLGRTALKLLVFLTAVIVIGMLLVPRLTRTIVRLNRPEITVIAAVGLAFGAGYLALTFDYSVALGAFLAGSLVAESGEEKTVEHLVQPVRDMFAAVFFVAVGMLIDPRVILDHWVPVLVFTLLVIAGKVIAVSVGAFLAGYGTRTAVQTGMSLAQIGEFSFIIAGVGLATGATRGFLYPVAVAVSAITTLTTPWLIRAAGPAASWVDRRLPHPVQNFVALYGSWMEQARTRPSGPRRARAGGLAGLLLLDLLVLLLIGLAAWQFLDDGRAWLVSALGLTPRVADAALAAALLAIAAPFVVGLIRLAGAIGQALALRALPAAEPGKVDLGNAPRRAFIVTWQLAGVCLLAVPLLAISRAIIPLPLALAILTLLLVTLGIAFWRSATNLQGHTRAGAEVIVAALGRQLAPAAAAVPEATSPTREHAASTLAPIYSMIPGLGEPVPCTVHPGDYADGRTLAELDLRDATDASVLVVVREGQPTILPEGKERLRGGDILALAGSSDAVDLATKLLRHGPG
ncbi:MAG TPA: cation:proton antiporter [Gemmatimonadales bacterium]|nr:cation:proton antiporter [Gemmatimonadales bacterium]